MGNSILKKHKVDYIFLSLQGLFKKEIIDNIEIKFLSPPIFIT